MSADSGQTIGSLLVAVAIVAVAVVAVTAQLGPTSAAELEAREERLKERQELREERLEQREELREEREKRRGDRPARRGDAATEVLQGLVRNLDVEGANRCVA